MLYREHSHEKMFLQALVKGWCLSFRAICTPQCRGQAGLEAVWGDLAGIRAIVKAD